MRGHISEILTKDRCAWGWIKRFSSGRKHSLKNCFHLYPKTVFPEVKKNSWFWHLIYVVCRLFEKYFQSKTAYHFWLNLRFLEQKNFSRESLAIYESSSVLPGFIGRTGLNLDFWKTSLSLWGVVSVLQNLSKTSLSIRALFFAYCFALIS